MSSNLPFAISVSDLSKEYALNSAGSIWQRKKRENIFNALTGVSFSIKPGEVVGVIGKNGAGKSTLLKILTRITAPTSGEVDLFGRVGSLLEVGTGFHPELTGRENVYLNGAILGMRRNEIRDEFDAIVSFAGVEKFLDTPVKRYSSGMYVRLAFAVAAHLRSEIPLIDEVLAVGDVEFQKRCLGKMRDVARSGRTILFVSHHLPSVTALCERVLVLDGGKMLHDGEVTKGIEKYMASLPSQKSDERSAARRPGTGELRVVDAGTPEPFVHSAAPKVVNFSVRQVRPYEGSFFISIHLVDGIGTVVAQCDSRLNGQWFSVSPNSNFEFTILTPWLKPGSYRIDIFLCASGFIDQCEQACTMEVFPLLPYPGAVGSEATAHGIILADFTLRETTTARNPIEGSEKPARFES